MQYKILSIATCVILFGTQANALELKTDKDAITITGNEIADIRDMLKNYIMTATELKYKAPDDRLKENMNDFEEAIETLSKKYKDPKVSEPLKKCKTVWPEFKKALSLALDKKVTPKKMKEGALYIHSNTKKIVWELMAVKKYLVSQAKVEDIKLYSAARNIGVAARGFASHYMLKMWEVNDPTIKEHWDNKVAKKFLSSIKLLRASKYASDEKVKSLLDKMEKDYKYLDKLFYGMNGNYMPSLADKKTTHMYKLSQELSDIILAK